jgi:asparagine synthase (glutamine-hydrolysing)
VSGLAGILHLDGAPVSQEDLETMLAAMPHRVAGEPRRTIAGPLAMANLGPAPDPSRASGEWVPVAAGDVRLDNRKELAASLAPRRAPDPTDLELVALSYGRWGPDLASHLQGDFAFAVWDPGRQRLVCARDRFGTKPFTYHAGSRRFAFASQPVGLLALAGISREVDDRAVARFLTDAMPGEPDTFFLALRRLPPATTLLVDVGGTARDPMPYWHLDPDRELRLASDADYEEAFRETFLETVRCRLPSEGEAGIAFSGGVDSSAVTGAARVMLPPPRGLRTYTVTATDPHVDERPYVEAVIAEGGLTSRMIPDDEVTRTVGIRSREPSVDSPYAALGLLLEGTIYAAAAADGVAVLLDGFDGDTVISHGIGRLTDLAAEGRLITLLHEARALSATLGWSVPGIVRAEAFAPLLPSLPRGRRPEPDSLASPDLVRSLPDEETARASGPRRPFARMEHLRDLTSPMNALTLEIMEGTAVRASVDLRHPFFDARLAELCLALPADQKLRDGWPRSILRRSMAGLVPDMVRWRSDKGAWGPTLAARALTPAWPQVTELVRTGGGPAAPYLDSRSLLRAYRACSRSGEGAASLWGALLLGTWLDTLNRLPAGRLT